MPRKRLTQIFPFLLPLRLLQRKKCFYLKMKLSKTNWAKNISAEKLPFEICKFDSIMVNQKSGYDIRYQLNKVHNLKLAADKMNGILIKPNETFSFWAAIKDADKKIPYKDGLDLTDGKVRGTYGGGLCHLSNLLFLLFLHTPLEIAERHPHTIEAFPSPDESDDSPCGTDATVHEGWLDLKVYNGTDSVFQIVIEFDDERGTITGKILSDKEQEYRYELFNKEKHYRQKNGKIFLDCTVDRIQTNLKNKERQTAFLYRNICEIAYKLPNSIKLS